MSMEIYPKKEETYPKVSHNLLLLSLGALIITMNLTTNPIKDKKANCFTVSLTFLWCFLLHFVWKGNKRKHLGFGSDDSVKADHVHGVFIV